MVIVTHSIDEAAALAADLIVLERGRVVTYGTMADVSRKPEFSAMLRRHDVGTALPIGSLRSNTVIARQNLWLRADQVLLSSKRPEAISARNIIEGRISGIRPSDSDDVLVELECSFGSVLSRVTMDAVQELTLKPGNNVWAIVKANSFVGSLEAETSLQGH
jgi:molybdate transport system ATP-binding protein